MTFVARRLEDERPRPLAAAAERLDWQPIALGSVRAGSGVSVHGRTFDGAKVRNLHREVDGDIARWIAAIESMPIGRD